MALTDDFILIAAARTLGEMHVENCGLGAIKDFARAIESAACAERDHEIAVLKQCLFQAQEAAKDLACQLAEARNQALEDAKVTCAGIGAGYTGAARRLRGVQATLAAGMRDGANECAAAIRAMKK